MIFQKRAGMAKVALLGVALLVLPLPAFSQGCALCYSQAASSGARMIAALRNGIFILIVPPMFLSVAITVLAYRRRNTYAYDDDELDPSDSDIPNGDY
jgi:hypothetical protein